MGMFNQKNPTVCEVCWDQPPVFLPLITCAHSSSFCEECIKRCLLERRFKCPKCRAIWPITQNHLNNIYVSRTVDHHPSAIIRNVYFPPSSTADGLLQTIFKYFSIGLLLGLIIYPAIKQP
jgi:hypothetical protein